MVLIMRMSTVMVPSATKNVRTPVDDHRRLKWICQLSRASPITSNEAAPMAGMESRKEKRAASGRSKPRPRAAVMVMPERLVPGLRERAWARQ